MGKSFAIATIVVALVAVLSCSSEHSPNSSASSESCASINDFATGTVTATITGDQASLDWENDLADADDLTIDITGPTTSSSATKPAVFTSLPDGNYTATITYSKTGCNSVTATKNFTIAAAVDCTTWDSSTVGTVTATPAATTVSVSWSGGTISGEDSFEVTVTGVTTDRTVQNSNPANFTNMSGGVHSATVLYAKAGCSDKTASSGNFTIPMSFSGDVVPLLATCTASCHGTNGGFTASSYSDWTAETPTSCSAMGTRVSPGDGVNSMWYLKVTGNTCGTQMGQGGFGSLSAGDIDRIKTWIDEGADNN